ncbi:MAG TPA: RidA family protein [Bryobacteraceae bacterium]|nr:RidA family protein [Bryobacteraceae bacterium]
MSVYDTLARMGIEVPQVTPPVAAYLPYVQTGNLIFVSGHIAKRNGQPWRGQLGINMATEEGREAARLVAIDLLGTLQGAAGDLKRIARIVNITVLVNSGPAFMEHHLVANGASELFQAVFGEAGRHARAAFGVAQIPLGACVEIVLTAELAPEQAHL